MNCKTIALSAGVALAVFASPALATCPTATPFVQNAFPAPLNTGTTANGADVINDINFVLQCPYFTGNVGVGTSTPQDKLMVEGSPITASYPIVSSSVYNAFSVRSSRPVNDYGGLYTPYAQINLVTLGTSTTGEANDHRIGDLRFSLKSAGVGTGMSDIMTLRYNGNVGIGTTTPTKTLEINKGSSSAGGIQIDGITDTRITIGSGQPTVWSWSNGWATPGDFSLIQENFSGSVIYVKPGGNVGIGTTTPSAKLDVSGITNSSGGYTQNSDIRLKTAIKPLSPGAVEVISQLQPVSFRWISPKDDGMKGVQIGFIAQDVEKILPSTVTTADDRAKTKGIKYNEITVLLVKALQEEHAIVQHQDRKITDLQHENEQLRRDTKLMAARLDRLEQTRVATRDNP